MAHKEKLIDDLKALASEELHEILTALKGSGHVTAAGCAAGYVPDGHGGCTIDVGPK